LRGWLRAGRQLREIACLAGWTSPKLGIRFEIAADELTIYRPDGRRFATYVELDRQRAQEHQRAEQEHQCAERLRAQLRALGIEPEG
ncbi:MAG: amidohydrolase, partial [Gammaproteobacteria bacterium]|nr:amidohydrolase [Gammaproteobacteria bacterium]